MSAALLVLPMVWASIEATTQHSGSPSLKLLAFPSGDRVEEVSPPHQEPIPMDGHGVRKGPHSLRLVQASAARSPKLDETTRTRDTPEVAFYRKHTEAMLRRYLKLSMELGSTPSLLGRDMFRGRVSNYSVSGFDDVVIFVADIEKCLSKLGKGQRYLVEKIVVQGFSQTETAAMLGMNLKIVIKHYREAVDRLTRLFLERKILVPHGINVDFPG